MAERKVSVTLAANIAGFAKDMDAAAKKVRSVGSEGEKLAQMKQAFTAIGQASLVMGAVIGAGVTVAVAKFAEFDAAMSNVQAATLESSENMALLRDAAIDAGASTVFSATEAAGAIEELAKAGVSTADILAGALSGSLDLAAAGQLGVARAAEITSTALNQYSLSGDKASHVADVLAAGAGKAMGSVEDLANGLKFVGPVAASMGVSLEETTGVLALFAQQGIIGEQAGTSLRGVLASLTSPSSLARGEIERLGLTLYDSQGNFLGLENAAGQLSKAYSNMDGASRDASLGVIFGRETVTAATALYKDGADGVDEWTAAVDDSGFAAEQARNRLDNLKGDLEALQGALDSALIQTGSAANETLRALVQSLTGLVDMYNDLPAPIQEATLVIGGATAAVALAGGTALLAVPKFLEMRSTITAAGISMKGLSLSAGGAGLALGGLFAIIGGLAQKHAEARAQAEAYADTLEDGTLRITNATKKIASENLAKVLSGWDTLWGGKINAPGSVFDNAERLGLNLSLVTDAAVGSSEALSELAPHLERIREGSEFAAAEAERLGMSQYEIEQAALSVQSGIQGEAESLDEATRIARQKEEATAALAGATDESAEIARTAAGAYIAEADAAAQTGTELSRLLDTINQANTAGQDAITSNIAYKDAMAQVDEQIQKAREGAEGYALTLDTNTQAGRDNMGMLVDLANRASTAAEKQFALDNNTNAYRATLDASRQALVDRATQLGLSADEAGALADQILRIPSSTDWEVIAKTAAANTEIARFIADAEQKVIRIGVATYAKDGPNGQIRISAPGSPDKYATGGAIHGPGGPRSDLIPILASNGEHMWTAREVQAAGGHNAVAAMRQAVLDGSGYASGGAIGYQQPRYVTGGGPTRTTLVTVEQHIHPAPGMDENAIVAKATRKTISEIQQYLR